MRNIFASGTLALAMAISGAAVADDRKIDNAPTIRTMSGATATTQLSAKQTAVIVIDIQNEYFPGGKMPIPDGLKALQNSKRILEFAHKNGMPVFFAQHLGAADGPLFAKGSRFAEFHKDLQPGKNDRVISKATPSSFVGTDLQQQLDALGIKQLIVTGLMTHMCVSSTARDAVPLGYSVIIPEDATATRDLATWDNKVVDHKILQQNALAAVADVFAEIKTTDAVLALPVH
ncbi:cysteine hydrolase [Pantoea sp. Acro-805]|uniref:Cysteine hydrolase n=1 Tax=Candidatus Pantoea formicae TaxID=2608355 RepID=A0ABX0R0H9_9GAMM|nr:cysteine hydrolase family protein [Pantoea formicae]MDF7648504.1 cysteine hydrolase family protein [Erwiniaceae bacterium L1_54_3]NIF02712.1 cysteine hydrolase [Pantoea formicae]